ncbi:MAG TPA: nucleotidyltransferase family protein [Actinophytocola sp.]|uniref:nucleotidyltransferase family protein n=1 Tax=Actinophytocola sp. TaxID=1872138 RepID=UPI002DBD6CCA|nr:nucleotidyltransferase family protein [Actinophytocola sp.]HEU5474975.1 nucleotidyltransferase family protein [Actinophytocola sp.]
MGRVTAIESIRSDQDALLRTLARVAKALRDADVPFAVTGGCAVYARGGPATEHDLDLLVREEDVPAAVSALVGAGMRAAEAAEDWLTKVYDGDRLVDLLFRPNERPVTEQTLERAEEMRVGGTLAPVQNATDVLVNKLLTLSEHRCDFSLLLTIARALREQIDWTRLGEQTASSPFAEAFLLLVARLNIASGDGLPEGTP